MLHSYISYMPQCHISYLQPISFNVLFIGNDVTSFQWVAGFPTSGGSDGCVFAFSDVDVEIGLQSVVRWKNSDCAAQRKFICESCEKHRNTLSNAAGHLAMSGPN